MSYSIIIPFRNRDEHLAITLPRLREVFAEVDHEIIIVEQADNKKFRRANLLNEGVRVATKELVVLHDVDYYPSHVQYYNWDTQPDVYLPVSRVTFVYNNLSPKPIADVPGGYRHFKDGVDADFFGGVTTFRRDAFHKINGFNPDFVGWGFEDADLRERVTYHGLRVERSETGHFLALDHIDSGPDANDADFNANIRKWQLWQYNIDRGLFNCHNALVEVSTETNGVEKWLRVTNFDAPVFTGIVSSNFQFDLSE